jgi:hypothetical protein
MMMKKKREKRAGKKGLVKSKTYVSLFPATNYLLCREKGY